MIHTTNLDDEDYMSAIKTLLLAMEGFKAHGEGRA